MLTRAFLSEEGKKYLFHAQEFWEFVVDKLLKNFPDRVLVREINFLPCFSAFVVETKNSNNLKLLEKPPFSYNDLSPDYDNTDDVHLQLNISTPNNTNLVADPSDYSLLTQCRDIYYSLMAAGSSHQCDYFYIPCNINGGNNNTHEKRLIKYINHCWLLGTKFDAELWKNRLEYGIEKDNNDFLNVRSAAVNEWPSFLKDP